MKYRSTRGLPEEVSSAEAIRAGIAPDGGLYLPTAIPVFKRNDIEELCKMNYSERAAYILSLFLTDYTYDELLCDAENAYNEKKFSPSPAPITELDEMTFMLELWHGPTCAFKDMALQLMPRLFVRAMKKCGEKRHALILTATSGDTGKAALEGYRDIPGVGILVFYPTDGVSSVQKLQMQTQKGSNLGVLGIKGNFDDAQNGVKSVFSSQKITAELNDCNIFLSSANSINWGRLAPQIVYYVSAYCDLISTGKISVSEKIDVCVPSGNFGNIFAAYLAKRMGLPIGKLICASNSNNVLTEFLTTGVYDRNRPFHKTISPSMDILISSNLERLISILFGAQRTRELMERLRVDGRYSLTPDELETLRRDFSAYSTSEDATAKIIKKTYEEKNCLTDPHTSVAIDAAAKYMNDHKAERKILIVSTASPFKFADSVYAAITGVQIRAEKAPEALHELTGTDIPTPLRNILKQKILHPGIIAPTDMLKAVKDFAAVNMRGV